MNECLKIKACYVMRKNKQESLCASEQYEIGMILHLEIGPANNS